MNKEFSTLTEIIRKRKSEFPATYKAGQIDPHLVNEILINASWAPNHKKTEPWRFVVIHGESKQTLSEFMAEHYRKTTDPALFDPVKQRKAGEKPLEASLVIALCVHRSPEALIPAWEETVALACAVQNMWLSCTALDIGCYWSTPSVIKSLGNFLELKDNEECLGLFYMGWSGHPQTQRSRAGLEQFCRWM